jgi:hypothetical protein
MIDIYTIMGNMHESVLICINIIDEFAGLSMIAAFQNGFVLKFASCSCRLRSTRLALQDEAFEIRPSIAQSGANSLRTVAAPQSCHYTSAGVRLPRVVRPIATSLGTRSAGFVEP